MSRNARTKGPTGKVSAKRAKRTRKRKRKQVESVKASAWAVKRKLEDDEGFAENN